MQPQGGTELQYKLLEKHVDSKLLDKFQITTSQGGSVIQGVISYALIDRSQENG